MKIEIMNPIYSKCDQPKLVKDVLSFQKEHWYKTQYNKKCKLINISKIDKSGIFYSGLVPKIQTYCKQNNIPLEITKSPEYIELIESMPIDRSRTLPGITLRDDQNRLVEAALKHKRGVLVAIARTGKTVIAAQIINCFPESNVLFLVPDKTLLGQTSDEFKRFGIDNIKIGEGNKEINNSKVVIATMQTMIKLDLDELADYFDIIIVDEAHKAVRNLATMEGILSKLIAPYRFGLTASPPETPEQNMILSGLIGDIIEEVTMEEAKEKGLLAEPTVKLIPIPKCKKTVNLKTYHDIHKASIIEYDLRNKIIADSVIEMVDNGSSVVIFVNELDHGERIYDLLVSDCDHSVIYLNGSSTVSERMKAKKSLNNKDIDICVSSIGKCGFNIPDLDCVALADIGKSKIELIQQSARSLTKSDNKYTGYILEFIDEERYISEHFARRMKFYVEQGFKIIT